MARRPLVLSLVLALAPATAAASPFETFDSASPRRQERAPAVTLKDAAGVEVRLPSGRPTVLVFGSFS
jgi:hypothetical protein